MQDWHHPHTWAISLLPSLPSFPLLPCSSYLLVNLENTPISLLFSN